MKLLEIDESLPHGFHDSNLRRIDFDCVEFKLTLHLDIWIGDTNSKSEDEQALHRPAVLTVTGLRFLIIDPPKQLCRQTGGLDIDAGPGQPSTSKIETNPLEDNVFLYWVFFSGWNSFMRLAGCDANLEWTGEPFVIGGQTLPTLKSHA